MTSDNILKIVELREHYKELKETTGWRYRILNNRLETEINLFEIPDHLVYMEQEAFDWILARCPDAKAVFDDCYHAVEMHLMTKSK